MSVPFTVITKRFKSIGLFAGCGGLDYGLHLAGFDPQLLVDCDHDCIETLKINLPGFNFIQGDIASVDFYKYRGGIDLVSGGFPCQPFSHAGKRLGFNDDRGTLFDHFVRSVSEIQPKMFVAENVKGLVTHEKGKTLAVMVERLQEIGYQVSWRLLDAHHFYVPQKRERLFIVGVRPDLISSFNFPEQSSEIYTLRQVLQGCPTSHGVKYPESRLQYLRLLMEGQNWRHLPEDVKENAMGGAYRSGGGKVGFYRRLAWDKPSPTITTSPHQKATDMCHPEELRPLNIRECARIQTFPDDWIFYGSIASQYKQIGNAVPVNLAFHLGNSIRKTLEECVEELAA